MRGFLFVPTRQRRPTEKDILASGDPTTTAPTVYKLRPLQLHHKHVGDQRSPVDSRLLNLYNDV